jgi:hypothetical protein
MLNIAAILLVPQLVGLGVFYWRSRRLDPRARLWGVVLPPLTMALPLLAIPFSGSTEVGPTTVTPDDDFRFFFVSIVLALVALHLAVAFTAHAVGRTIASEPGDAQIHLDLKPRRPN